ncbi:MAG: LTA synthase family protein [Chitinophagaceae bacterium]
MKEKLFISTRAFTGLMAGWVLLLLLMRIAEWLINGYQHQFPDHSASFLLTVLQADLIFISRIGLLLFILFILIGFLSLLAARIVFLLLVLVFSLGYFALQQYYLKTGVLLGADLYGYSAKDIQQTAGASGGVNWMTIAALLTIAVVILLLVRFNTRRLPSAKTTLIILIALLIPGRILSWTDGPLTHTSGEYASNLAQNKLDYFLQASYLYFNPPPHETDIYSDAYSGDFGNDAAGDSIVQFIYTNDKEYPFLHADSTTDVLSPFIGSAGAKPNIVIILVEGLGRAFTNEGAYLGNFTPFLDSLSQQSLYWENFLSGGGRTFAVLPSLLGSLPFGKNGFCELKPNMPPHQTLMSILGKEGFTTSFYYGGDASFDNMDYFLQQQQIGHINDKKTFPAGYAQLPANNGFTWGYGDRELFRYYFQSSAASGTPRLDVLLTVSTHSPFMINEAAAYQQKFNDRLQKLGLSDQQQTMAKTYSQQLGTVLYADDALRYFFAEYAKRPDFANTIFLITGDHRMPEIPMSSKIDRYHVPLIMYSPLLQRTARFQSVSSHFDITPSLLAFLRKAHGLQTPSLVTWLGSGLDTARSFRNIHAQALMQTKTDIIDYVRGRYHLNGNTLFSLTPTMQEEPVNDASLQQALRAGLDQYLEKNQRMLQTGRLQPK